MSSILSQLLDVISKSIKAWEGFISDDGDRDYFSDIYSFSEPDRKNPQYISLRTINNLFKTLESYQQTLVALEKSCDKTARDVSQSHCFSISFYNRSHLRGIVLLTDILKLQLRLARQNSEAVEYNGVTGGFTSLVGSLKATKTTTCLIFNLANFSQVISPFMLASAVFSLPPHVIPVKVNFKSFIIAVFVSMAFINLLFFFHGILSRRSSWWKGIATRMRAIQLSGLIEMRLPLFSECYSGIRSPRRGCSTSDETAEDVEMTMGV